jgi:hypothetical protein
MDLKAWEGLWKTLAIIGIATIFIFFIIVFVLAIDYPLLIWILIALESACYLGIIFVRRHTRRLLR